MKFWRRCKENWENEENVAVIERCGREGTHEEGKVCCNREHIKWQEHAVMVGNTASLFVAGAPKATTRNVCTVLFRRALGRVLGDFLFKMQIQQ